MKVGEVWVRWLGCDCSQIAQVLHALIPIGVVLNVNMTKRSSFLFEIVNHAID
jgi:hypothetical protein